VTTSGETPYHGLALSSEKAAMFVSRRTLLQGSLLCAVGMVHGSSPALAQEFAAPPTPDERKRMARLAADFMDTYNVPGLSVAIAIEGKPAYSALQIRKPAKH
jgi:CubicO group peptidase (beta-lactamase class C family)